DLRFGRLFGVGRRGLMNGPAVLVRDGPRLVHRLTDDIHDAPQRAVAHRHRYGLAGVGDLLAAHQALGRVHGDGAHRGLTEVLGDLEHQPLIAVLGLQRIENGWQSTIELDVDNRAHHLANASDFIVWHRLVFLAHALCFWLTLCFFAILVGFLAGSL